MRPSNLISAMPRLAALLTILLIGRPGQAQPGTRGIQGERAPEWNVTQWRNLPDGVASLDPDDLDGKVIYLYCFQSWCPGCHSRGFPTLQTLIGKYADADDVRFVAIQTVFEGYATNTPEAAWRTGERYGLEIPIGHDGGPAGRSTLMQRYRTGGTPWAIIIDRDGRVRYDDFHISVADASRLIDELRRQPRASDEPAPAGDGGPVTLPSHRGGQELLGRSLPPLAFDGLASPAPTAEPVRATLYRWWTDGCAACEASLPAIDELRRRFGDDGLRVVAVYHPKPPRSVSGAMATRLARERGYRGAVALDLDWSELERAYATERVATSVSLLVDDAGVIRFVHPGPLLHPSDDPARKTTDADYQTLERAIVRLLGVAPAPDGPTTPGP